METVTYDCWNCKYGLGGGLCRLNLEGECAAGDEPVAWEPKEEEQDGRPDFEGSVAKRMC